MEKDKIKLIAFYLQQFHLNELNNKLWGDGFTEWTNVAQGRPNFEGHYQPHIPGKLGFYDLSFQKNIEKQVQLAKEYGIGGFCFYYYWFDGKRALETPLNIFLQSAIDFPFCICWANENWSKRWDGGNNEIVLKQNYGKDFEKNFIFSIKSIISDCRYIKIDGQPLIILYRPTLFPNPVQNIKNMRTAAFQAGLNKIKIFVVDFYIGEKDAKKMGADGIIEFPPHQFYDKNTEVDVLPGKLLNPAYVGHVLDYRKIILRALKKWNDKEDFLKIRGIIPSWDNTARKRNTSLTIVFNSPKLYFFWLSYLLKYSKERNLPFIFINAWNEWGEGCHLEPDRMDGLAYLQATKDALEGQVSETNLKEFREELVKQLNKSISENNPPRNLNYRDNERTNKITFRDFVAYKVFDYPFFFNLIRKLYRSFNKNR